MIATASLLLALLTTDLTKPEIKPVTEKSGPRQESRRPQPLSFNEFFEPSAGELKPSQKLLALNGQPVKMVGYMVDMEHAPSGAFYLAPRPVFCDEAGGGTADLPPESVRVIVRSAQGKKIQFIPRALEVMGILQVGNLVEEDGQVSAIRLILDRPKDKRIRGTAKHSKPTQAAAHTKQGSFSRKQQGE